MATDTTKILVGAGVVSIGDFVTAGGAGSLVDVGHTKEPVAMSSSFTDFDVTSERALGILRKIPQDMAVGIRIPMLETIPDRLAIALRQPAANVSGIAPDETILVGGPVEQYHQIEIVGPGPGTLGIRTITAWRGIVIEVAEMAFAKGDSMVYNVTLALMLDDSVATADKFFKQIDT